MHSFLAVGLDFKCLILGSSHFLKEIEIFDIIHTC